MGGFRLPELHGSVDFVFLCYFCVPKLIYALFLVSSCDSTAAVNQIKTSDSVSSQCSEIDSILVFLSGEPALEPQPIEFAASIEVGDVSSVHCCPHKFLY